MNEQETRDMIAQMNEDVEGKKRNVWTPPSNEEGTYTLRFLPPLKKLNEKIFYFRYRVSFLNGVPFLSLNQTMMDANGNEHMAELCPMEIESRKLFSSGEKGSPEWRLAAAIAPKYRYLYRIVLRGSDDETQPMFYESGTLVFNKLYTILTSSDNQFGNIVDPIKGRDFRLIKSGVGRQSKYDNSMPSLESIPIFPDKERMQAMFENAENMLYSSLINFSPREQVEDAVNQILGKASKITVGVPNTPLPKIQPKPTPAPTVETLDEDDELQDLVNSFTA